MSLLRHRVALSVAVSLLAGAGVASADSPWTDPDFDVTPSGGPDADLFLTRESFFPIGDLSGYGLSETLTNLQAISLGVAGSSETGNDRAAVHFAVEFTNVGPGFEILVVDSDLSGSDNALWGLDIGSCSNPFDGGPGLVYPGGAPTGGAFGVNDGWAEVTTTRVEGWSLTGVDCSTSAKDMVRIIFTHGDAVEAGTEFEVTLVDGVAFDDTVTAGGLVVGAAQGDPLDVDYGFGDHGEGASFVVPLVPWPLDDSDDDGFSPAQGDCDDGDPAIFPAATEVCDGQNNDCDGLTDEPRATSWQCRPDTVLQEQLDPSDEGNLILHVEKFVESVDLTGIPLYQDSTGGVTVDGGPATNVHSVLIRNWQGNATDGVLADAVLTFPPEVTILGWVVDYGSNADLNRALDAVFAVSGQSLQIPGMANTWFGSSSNDWVIVDGQVATFHSILYGAADEARVLVSYDPFVVGELLVDVDMSAGGIQDLTICEEDQDGLSYFTFPLTTIDRDLQDLDLDGFTTCTGDCHDQDDTIYPGAEEECDEIDSDCDGDLVDGFDDVDDDGIPDCVDDEIGDDDDSAPGDDDDTTDDDDSADDDDDDDAGDDDDGGLAGSTADCTCALGPAPHRRDGMGLLGVWLLALLRRKGRRSELR